VGCKLVNWTKPEYPQSLLQIYDPLVGLYVRGDASILNSPSLAMVWIRCAQQSMERRGQTVWDATSVGGRDRGFWAPASMFVTRKTTRTL